MVGEKKLSYNPYIEKMLSTKPSKKTTKSLISLISFDEKKLKAKVVTGFRK